MRGAESTRTYVASSGFHDHTLLTKIIVTLYLWATLGLNAVILVPVGQAEDSSNRTFIVSWLVVQALLLLRLSFIKAHQPTSLLISVAFSIYLLSSTLWSVNPDATLIYGGMLAANIFSAHLVASQVSLSEFIGLVFFAITSLVVLGIIAYSIGWDVTFYLDTHGRPNYLGTQPARGFFPHKIMASLYACLGLLLALAKTRGFKRMILVLVFLTFILLTGSATGIILSLVGLLVHTYVASLTRKGISLTQFLVRTIVFSTLSLLVFVRALPFALTYLGRDLTLTGRTILWSYGIDAWLQRPILGWGFEGYFRSAYSDVLNAEVSSFENYDVPHFHQSFIQTAVDLGAIGLAFVVYIIVYVMFSLARRSFTSHDSLNVVLFSVITTILIAAFTMRLFLTYNHFITFFLLTLFFMLKRTQYIYKM